MTNDRVTLELSNGLGAHTAEIIIGRVILPDMLKAEAKILPLAQTPHGRAELPRLAAARMLAARSIVAGRLFGRPLDSHAVE